MSPLQKIAMGLVIVILDAYLGGFDAVPDVLGWLLVLLGVHNLRTVMAASGTLVTLAGLSAVVSGLLLWPGLADSVPESGGWLLSLPQLAFSIVLCRDLARLAAESDDTAARRFRSLSWLLTALAVVPVLVFGGGLDVLLVPTAVLSVAVYVYLVYWLFKVSKKAYALA